jgi:phage shock protein E
MMNARSTPLAIAVAIGFACFGADLALAQAPAASGLKTARQVVESATAGMTYESNEILRERLEANPDLLLLDVRSLVEFEAGHIPGATWMDSGLVEFQMAQAVRDPDREIFVTCASGNRTGHVVKALRALGYRNVRGHVGFNAWVDAGHAFENFLGEARMTQRRPLQLSTPLNRHFDQRPLADRQR